MDPAIISLILLLLKEAPAAAVSVKALIDSLKGDMTDEQRAEVEAAQQTAHNSLQAAVADAVAEESKTLGE